MQCPFCNADKDKILPRGWRKAGFELISCKNCSNYFVSPLPSNEELEVYYKNSYLNRTEKHVQKKEDKLTGLYHEIIKKWHPAAKLIYEVGCSEGNLLYGLKNRGFEVRGFEISTHSAELGKKVFDLQITPSPLPKDQREKADVLISSHVVEHLRNPRDDFAAYANNLKQGGIVIITTPNFKSLIFKIFGNFHIWFNPPDHLFYFDKHNLTKDLKMNGLSLEVAFTRNDKYSLLAMFVLSLLNAVKEVRTPTSPSKWKELLVKPEARPLPKKSARSYIYKAIEFILNCLSLPIEVFMNWLKLGDELWIVARKQ